MKGLFITFECIDFERGHVTRFEIEQEAAEEKNLPWYKKVIEAVA